MKVIPLHSIQLNDLEGYKLKFVTWLVLLDDVTVSKDADNLVTNMLTVTLRNVETNKLPVLTSTHKRFYRNKSTL